MNRKLSNALKLLVPALLLLCTTFLLVQVALSAMYQEKQDKLVAISNIVQHRILADPSISFALASGSHEDVYQRIQRLFDETFLPTQDLSASLYVPAVKTMVAYAPRNVEHRTLPFLVDTPVPPEMETSIETSSPEFFYADSVVRSLRVYNYAVPLLLGNGITVVLSVNQAAHSIYLQETAIWASGIAVCLIALALLLTIAVRTYRREQHLQREQDNLISWLKTYDGDSFSDCSQHVQFELLKDLPNAFKEAVDLVHIYRRQQRHALDQLSIGLLTLDAEGQVVYANPYFSQMFGYSQEEARSWSPEDWRRHYRMFDGSFPTEDLAHGARFENCPGLFQHKNGEMIPISVTFREIENGQDEPAGWLVICYDLSQKFAIDRLTQQTQVMLQSVALNMLLVDSNMRIEHITPELCRLVGRHEKELIGQSLSDVQLWQFPGQENALMDALLKVFSSGRRAHLPQENTHVAGREYKLEFALFPILNPLMQDVEACMIFVKDNTLYQEWEQLSRRVDEHSHYVQMAATIAHEVRNPMTSVRGFLQLLAKELQGDDQLMYLHIMQTEIDRMNAILSEYLSMARPVQQMEVEKINLAALVRETFLVLEGEANYRGVELTVNLEDTGRIEGNARELKQVLINLVRNAFDALEGTAGKIEIRLRQEEQDGSTRIEVADNGCGMTEEQIARIFEPFFTTKATGTGLGLPVCKKIIDSHGGTLSVTSQIGVGTKFLIRFARTETVAEVVGRE